MKVCSKAICLASQITSIGLCLLLSQFFNYCYAEVPPKLPLVNRIEIFRQTSETKSAIESVTSALHLLPTQVEQVLTNTNFKIILAPTLLECFPQFKDKKPDWTLDADFSSCPAVYNHRGNTLYIAERWKGFKETTLKHNLLHETGHAYDDAKGSVSSSAAFNRLIQTDGEHLTVKQRAVFRYDKTARVRSRELYAEFFATAISSREKFWPSSIEDKWYFSLASAFPRSYEYVYNSLFEKGGENNPHLPTD